MHRHLPDSDYLPFEIGMPRSVALGSRGLLLLLLGHCCVKDIGSGPEQIMINIGRRKSGSDIPGLGSHYVVFVIKWKKDDTVTSTDDSWNLGVETNTQLNFKVLVVAAMPAASCRKFTDTSKAEFQKKASMNP
jgi:hypothetical protein